MQSVFFAPCNGIIQQGKLCFVDAHGIVHAAPDPVGAGQTDKIEPVVGNELKVDLIEFAACQFTVNGLLGTDSAD